MPEDFFIQNLPALLYYKVLLFLRYAAILSISPCRIARSSAAIILSFFFRKFGPVRYAAIVWWVMNVQPTVRFSTKIFNSSSISFSVSVSNSLRCASSRRGVPRNNVNPPVPTSIGLHWLIDYYFMPPVFPLIHPSAPAIRSIRSQSLCHTDPGQQAKN